MIKNYIFLGPPGVGKGTLATKLEKERGGKHISIGDLFREAIKEETKLGLQVKDVLSSGEYVADELTNALVKEVLDSDVIKQSGFILDGYPRTLNQTTFLKEQGYIIDGVILLLASDEIVKNRLLNRQRIDDDPKIITKRIDVYNTKTKPLIDFYKKQNLLIEIDANGNIEQNFENLLKRVK